MQVESQLCGQSACALCSFSSKNCTALHIRCIPLAKKALFCHYEDILWQIWSHFFEVKYTCVVAVLHSFHYIECGYEWEFDIENNSLYPASTASTVHQQYLYVISASFWTSQLTTPTLLPHLTESPTPQAPSSVTLQNTTYRTMQPPSIPFLFFLSFLEYRLHLAALFFTLLSFFY